MRNVTDEGVRHLCGASSACLVCFCNASGVLLHSSGSASFLLILDTTGCGSMLVEKILGCRAEQPGMVTRPWVAVSRPARDELLVQALVWFRNKGGQFYVLPRTCSLDSFWCTWRLVCSGKFWWHPVQLVGWEGPYRVVCSGLYKAGT